MGKNGETILPTHSCDRTLADQFLSFLHNKIDNIRTDLCAMVDEPLVEIPDQSFNGIVLFYCIVLRLTQTVLRVKR